MAVGDHAFSSGAYHTKSITASTNVRDVSEMLDLWAHKWTPLLNKISWAGGGSGGLEVEWISEHLGFGYVQTSGAIASGAAEFTCTTSGTALTTAEVIKQVQAGTMLYANLSGDTSGECFYVVTTVGSTSAGTVGISILAGTTNEVEASTKLYIVGHFANEASDPYLDMSRARSILSNNFSILRKDIKISGSMANTDMYAVDNEPRHQMAMRLLEMQFERERTILLSKSQARTSTIASFMKGAHDFLDDYSGNAWVDASTTTLTESTFNDLIAECWDNGGNPTCFVAASKHCRLFTDWDKNKVRTTPDARLAGHWVTKYLTDVGTEVELIPMRKFPVNLGFVLDTDKMEMVAKKNRKLIVEKLAKTGDYERWQLLSEFTLIMRGYDKGYHGMFMDLS